MKLYNQKTGKIENKKFILDKGSHYVNKLTEDQLNGFGYYLVEYPSKPSRRYYEVTKNESLTGNKYVVGYTVIDRPLDQIKSKMISDLFAAGEAYENTATIDTGLGFEVEASPRALQAYSLGSKKSKTKVRDKNFQGKNVRTKEIDDIVIMIEDKLVEIFEIKETKFDEIMLLNTAGECEAYERSPYDHTVTAEEALLDDLGTTIEGSIVTRHKNKVKEWF